MTIDAEAAGAGLPGAPEPVSAPVLLARQWGPAASQRSWHRCGTRYRLRLESLGAGGAIRGLRIYPLPCGVLLDWNKALPAEVRFHADHVAISAATGRAILDALASLRFALPGAAAETNDVVLEFDLAVGGRKTVAVTTFTLEREPRPTAR